MATPSTTTTRGAASPWSLHANALNLMAQRGETTAMKRAIDSGADINETDRDWIRAQIGVVLQDPFLYAQTIDSNLRVGRPAAPYEDLLQAAQDASLHE